MIGIITTLFSLFRSNGVAGVNEGVLETIQHAFTDFITKDAQAQAAINKGLQDARDADAKTFDPTIHWVNAMRSAVRPVCTFVAMGWYVYARVAGIPFGPEDYAIVGGIIAFWFGFRPFEKTVK